MSEKVIAVQQHHQLPLNKQPDHQDIKSREQQRRHRLQQLKKQRTSPDSLLRVSDVDDNEETLRKVASIAGNEKARKGQHRIKDRKRDKERTASSHPAVLLDLISTTLAADARLESINEPLGELASFSTSPTPVSNKRSRRTRRPRTTSSTSTSSSTPTSVTTTTSPSAGLASSTDFSPTADTALTSTVATSSYTSRLPSSVFPGIDHTNWTTIRDETLSFTATSPVTTAVTMPSVVRPHHQLGPSRVINVTVYPEVSKEAVVVPILTSMFAFPVLAFTLICLLRRRAQRLRKFEPRHRALRVNTSFSPSRARAKTSLSTPGTPAPYILSKPSISCLPAIIVDPPFIAAPQLVVDPIINKHSVKFTPPSTPPTSSSGADHQHHQQHQSTIKQIVAAATASAVRFEVQVSVEPKLSTSTGNKTSSNTLSEAQINGEDSGVCCSIPRESFSSTSGLINDGEEIVECESNNEHDDVNADDDQHGCRHDEQQRENIPAPSLLSFTGTDKMTAAMLNVQLVDKITVTGITDEGSNSDSAKEASNSDGDEDEEDDSDQAVTVLLEPPAEFADEVQRRQSLLQHGNAICSFGDKKGLPSAVKTPPTSLPTSATSIVSSDAIFSSCLDDFQLSGAEARPNSPTALFPSSAANISTLLLPADVIATVSRTMSSTASGCRVIEVCIPASASSNSASEKDEDMSNCEGPDAADVAVEFDRRSSSVASSSVDWKRDDEGYYQETDDDVEEGSERTLVMIPRPAAARVVSKGIQVNDLKIGTAFCNLMRHQQNINNSNRKGIRQQGRTSKMVNGSVVRPVDRHQQQHHGRPTCDVEKGGIISEVRANIALRSVQQQQHLASSSASSPWVLRSSAAGLSSSGQVRSKVSKQIR